MNTTALMAARAYATVKGTLALVGLAALAVFSMLPTSRELLLGHLPVLGIVLPGDSAAAVPIVAEGPIQTSIAESAREQRVVSEFIAKRYRVAEQAAAGFVSIAYRAGAEYSVDPLLILAVMAVESRYNPVAESVVGAKGLMQVIAKFHLDKLVDHGGEHALLQPEVNIYVGAQILREYLRRFGDTETALQMYAGAFDEPTSQYASKVLAEKARLEAFRQKAKKQNV